MIDIHTHILPMTDDGAESFETGIEMVKTAWKCGTDSIVLTPHFARAYGFFCEKKELEDRFAYFQEIIRKDFRIPAELHLGMEVLYEGRERFLSNRDRMLTLNGSRYLLMEYYFDMDEAMFFEGIETVKELGLVPVIAHPERYECVQERQKAALEAVKKGAVLQINKGSLSGRYGKSARDTVFRLLKQKLVHVVASDAHNTGNRNPDMSKAEAFLLQYLGKRETRMLLYENPDRILKDEILSDNRGDVDDE